MEETSTSKKMILDVNEKPSIAKWIILAFQHVFAMFGATILVPILVNTQAKAEVLTIPVALVTAGIGTLIYILCTRGKSPVFLGLFHLQRMSCVLAAFRHKTAWETA